MSGLIFFQVYWIRSSVRVNEEQFDQLVNKTLTDIAIKIQKQEAVFQVINQINPAFFDTNLYRQVSSYYIDSIVPDNNIWIKLQHDIKVTDDQTGQVPVTTEQHPESSIQLQHSSQEKISEHYSTEPSGIGQLFLQREILINSIIENMFRLSPRIEDRINKQELQQLLENMFRERGIPLDFEYSVTKWNTMTAFKSVNYKNDDDTEYYKVRLFPDDIYSESNYLVVYFPEKSRFIFKSLGFMAISSISLTLILILSFAIAIYIIFKQKRLSEIRNDFVSNMTHELKTPISTISLASQMLGDQSIPDKLKNIDYLSGVISEESKKLGYHVEKVLQLAIFERGKLELKFKVCDLHEIIMNVIHTFDIQIKHRGGNIIRELNAENYSVSIDQVHITNVFSNLIDNAIKFCERNPEIKIASFNENGYLGVSIADNGIGMNKQDIKKIFEKFYRIPTGNIHTVKGFGLGLSYVKKIVEEHQGHIKVESKPFEGTVFKVYLPSDKIHH
ncbi:MAG: HAMP domain-containing histidine kinase [Bacteroidales bacterium]|nr:HAMP domain-containing histidine kinase [Bacteroidales bacterium]